MNCPVCGSKMNAEVELTGGCSGHYGDDAQCYCDAPDVSVRLVCPKAAVWQTIDGKCREAKNRCKQEPLDIKELGDQYALGRWLTDHYVPTPGTPIF